MACTFYMTVKDVKFAFHFGLGDGDGVVVESGVHDVYEPGFAEALQEALFIYPTLDAVISLEHYAHAYARDTDTDAQLKNHMYGAPEGHIEDVIQWYATAESQDYLDVSDIMVRYAHAAMNERERREKKSAKETAKVVKQSSGDYKGYVYLIQSPTGAYKIGRTVNPKDRLKTFSVKLPFEVEYVCIIQTDNMYTLESELHKLFESRHVNGEWFALSAADVEYIKGLSQ